MARFTLWLAGSVLSMSALASAIYGCSSDPAPPPADEDAGDDTPGPTPPKPPPAPAPMPPAPPPTPASNPGMVSCGSNTCSTGSQICCWVDNDKERGQCQSQCSGGTNFEVKCDEPADCVTGGGGETGKCCVKFGEAACDADCTGFGGIELCKTDADCEDGVKCTDRICKRGPTGQQVDLPLRVCGTPADCP